MIIIAPLSLSGQANKESALLQKNIWIAEIDNNDLGTNLLLASLQGLVAKKYPEIYLSAGDKANLWLDEFQKYGFNLIRPDSWEQVYNNFKGFIKGYILVDSMSITVGASLAGPYHSVLIMESHIPHMKRSCIPETMDLRGKDEQWLYDYVNSNPEKFNYDAILQSIGRVPLALVDFAISNNYIRINGFNNPELVRKFYSLYPENSIRFGWGSPMGREIDDVSLGAEYGLFTIPTGNTLNLSVLNKLSVPAIEDQKRGTGLAKDIIIDTGQYHYVMIMMSDGDNLNWYINGMGQNEKYYKSNVRGDFPVTWMIPPNLFGLAPIVSNYFYRERSTNDFFVGSVSGQGYTYPSRHKNLMEFSQLTGSSLKFSKLDFLTVMDLVDLSSGDNQELDLMLKKMPSLKGILYMDYSNYAKWKGLIRYIDDRPVVAFRHRLWLPMDPWQKIAAEINNSPCEPNSAEGYSAVVVHAWSYSLDDVAQFVSALAPHVKVVDPTTFFNLIKNSVNIN